MEGTKHKNRFVVYQVSAGLDRNFFLKKKFSNAKQSKNTIYYFTISC